MRGHRSESWPGFISEGIVKQSQQSETHTLAPAARRPRSTFQQGCRPNGRLAATRGEAREKSWRTGMLKAALRAEACEKMALREWEACPSICLSGGGLAPHKRGLCGGTVTSERRVRGGGKQRVERGYHPTDKQISERKVYICTKQQHKMTLST